MFEGRAVISAGGRRKRARTVIFTIVLAALAAVAGLVSTAASFTLPLETTAPVKAPTVALTTLVTALAMHHVQHGGETPVVARSPDRATTSVQHSASQLN